jgi:E3 ubiquitin-protein ligase RNF14
MKQIVECFLNGDELTKASLVKKYGEKRLKNAIEEYQSVELITSTSKQCPSCKSWMQKLDGCNKMTCVRCHCYFCWLCLKSLSKTDPYSHFNTAMSSCFDKLFENITEDFNDAD